MTKYDPLVRQEDRVHVDLGMVYLLPDVELNLFVRSEKLDNICRGLAHKINLDSLSMVIAGKALPSWCPLRIWAKLRDSFQDFPLSEWLLAKGDSGLWAGWLCRGYCSEAVLREELLIRVGFSIRLGAKMDEILLQVISLLSLRFGNFSEEHLHVSPCEDIDGYGAGYDGDDGYHGNDNEFWQHYFVNITGNRC